MEKGIINKINNFFKSIHFPEIIRLMSLMKNRLWIYLTILILQSAIFSSLQAFTAFINKDMINSITSHNTKLLNNALVLTVLTLVLNCIVQPITVFMTYKNMKKTVGEIRLDLYSHIEMLPSSYFDKHHSGDLVSRFSNDLTLVEGAYSWSLTPMVATIISTVIAIVSMFVLEWRLSILIIILGFISLGVNVLFAGPLRSIRDKIQSSFGMLTQRLSDILAGFRVLKMFSINEIIVSKYKNYNEKLADLSMQGVVKNSQMNALSAFIGVLSMIGVFFIGTYLVSVGKTDIGTVFAIITVQGSVAYGFSNLGNSFAQLQNSLAGAARIFEIFDETKEPSRYIVSGDSDYKSSIDTNEIITFKNINFSYEKRENVLNGLDISVSQGQIAALVGPSGGGKSTVIKLLLGLYKPDSGMIAVNGKLLHEYTLEELRSNMSYVPQDAYLFDGTIEENIRFGRLDATKDEIIAAAKGANAHDFITEMKDEYDTRVGERGMKLSGGQRQRIAIARALLKNAPILLLDEATSSLDSESEQLVQQALNELMKGRTTVVIAHRLSTIEHADVIYVIENGVVSEQGSHLDLLDGSGLYKYLYELGSMETELEAG